MRVEVAGARRTVERGVRALLCPRGVRGVIVEGVWVAAHVALYPLGVLGERARAEADRFSLDPLPPVQRGLVIGNLEAAGTPILLVHGMIDNRSIFTVLRRGLRRHGFGRVSTMNYSVLTSDVRSAAGRLAQRVEQLCEQTGYERVHVVGHSLGGLVARYYVQRLGGDARVHTLVTLGTPHEGTWMSRLLPAGVARQLGPSASLIRELAEPAPGCRTRFVAVWSDLDQLMVPKRAAQVSHPDLVARNILLRGIGHMSLPVDRRVVHLVVTTLAHLDTDGQTVATGVTSLNPPSHPRTGPASRARSEAG